MSDIIDISTKAKLRPTPDDNLKEVVSTLQGLLSYAQEGKITGFVIGALLADGTSKVYLAGEASADAIRGVGLANHAANVLSFKMVTENI